MSGQVATVALLTLSCEEEAIYMFLNGSLYLWDPGSVSRPFNT